ncbi:MAG: sigma-54 dependent transcriptional regulator [Desulfovibrionaceae bacterium]|nr:sigma-54 dependent transcriptional regulator [Desulfovibrionaceae bacterium]
MAENSVQDSLPLLRGLFAIEGLIISRKSAAQLCRLSREDADAALDRLLADGAIRESGGAGFAGTGTGALPRGLKSLDAKLARALVLYLEGGRLAACALLHEEMAAASREGRIAAVETMLDICLAALGSCADERAPGREFCRAYLDIFRRTADTSIRVHRSFERVTGLMPAAKACAARLGDIRSELLLNLSEGILLSFSPSHNTEYSHSLLTASLDRIRELGDRDILIETAPGVGLLQFMEGSFSEALASLEAAAGALPASVSCLDGGGTRAMAVAAGQTGQPGRACGCLIEALHEAELAGNVWQEKWSLAQLADTLVCLGRRDEGLALLNGLLERIDPESETFLWFWAMRALAHCQYENGGIEESRGTFARAIAYTRAWFREPFYFSSWLLDMLHSYSQAGFPSIPGCAFEDELRRCAHSPNRHLAGCAARIAAEEHIAKGEFRAARRGLVRALRSARRTGAVLEVAKCCDLLALCQSERQTRRRAFFEDIAEGIYLRHTDYARALRDDGTGSPEGGGGSTGRTVRRFDGTKVSVATFRETLRSLPPVYETGAALSRLLTAFTDCFEIERAVLVSDGESFAPVRRHVSAAELGRGHFGELLAAGLREIDAGRRLPWHQEGGARFVPVPLAAGSRPALLVFESVYFHELADCFGAEEFAEIGRILGDAVDGILRLAEGIRTALSEMAPPAPLPDSRTGAADADGSVQGREWSRILRLAEKAAPTDAAILILGETGVGKEVLARKLHELSGRKGHFVAVHPASISSQLVESELFGHEKGAFTGAVKQKQGLVELADEGTLFIDEVGDVPMEAQVRLLRVLQEKTFMRIGGIREITSRFRLVCATNRDLLHMVDEGTFRRDFYYRISTIPFTIPPLRERKDEIPALVRRYHELFCRQYGKTLPPPDAREIEALTRYAWPGNIRELRSRVESAVILHEGHLLAGLEAEPSRAAAPARPSAVPDLAESLYEGLPSMEELQKTYIRRVLRLTRGKIDGEGGALAILKMKRSTLYAKIRAWGLDANTQLYGSVTGESGTPRRETFRDMAESPVRGPRGGAS